MKGDFLIDFVPRPVRPYVVGAFVGVAMFSTVYAVDQKINNHLRDVESARVTMIQFAKWTSGALQALCKANPDAKCPDVPPPVWPSPRKEE
jgi:hypothetical protein